MPQDEDVSQEEIDSYIATTLSLRRRRGHAGDAAIHCLTVQLRAIRLAALQLLEQEQRGFSGPRTRGDWNLTRDAFIETLKKGLYPHL